ncbi:hypothetical protein IJT93_07900 [bacterium]|nr:hypothetical protein [bacterium]
MKKLFILPLLTSLLLLPSCVSKSEFEALKQDHEKLKSQVADLQEQLQKEGGKPAPGTHSAQMKKTQSTASYIGGDTLYRNFESYRGTTVTVKGMVATSAQDHISIGLFNENGGHSMQIAKIEPTNGFDQGIISGDKVIINGSVSQDLLGGSLIVIKPISIKRA